MAKFITVTADDTSNTPLLINPDHIVSIVEEKFSGITKIMVPGAMFAVKEDLETIKAMLNPN